MLRGFTVTSKRPPLPEDSEKDHRFVGEVCIYLRYYAHIQANFRVKWNLVIILLPTGRSNNHRNLLQI
jgi:hypothetical protein